MSPIQPTRLSSDTVRRWTSVRTGVGLWLEKAWQLVLEAAKGYDAGELSPDVSTLEPKILYSASPAVVSGSTAAVADSLQDVAVQQTTTTPITDLMVVDSRLNQIDQLIGRLLSSPAVNHRIEVITVDSHEDGITQITERLGQLENVGSIQIFAHGNDGQLLLGNSLLDADRMGQFQDRFTAWAGLVNADADLLIYSCNTAASDRGIQFLQQIHAWTQMDIAASNDITGALEWGGNWNLEYRIGDVESQTQLASDFLSQPFELLTTIQVTTFADLVDGNTNSIAALLASQGSDNAISLREAVLAANATAGSDIIVLGSGTYTFSISGANENNSQTGDLNITDDLEILGAGFHNTIIDAASVDRLFTVDNHANFSLSDLTLTGGMAPSNRDGGAIYVSNSSTLSLSQVRVHDSSATLGGAIYVDQSTLLIDRSQFDHNAAAQGGAIYNRSGTVTITNSAIALNAATQRGGAIYNDASGTSLRLTNATLSNNTANIQGGAIYTKGNVAINQSTIAYNQSTGIGGVLTAQGTTSIQNSILAFNTSGNAGGAMQSLGNNVSDLSVGGLNQLSDRIGNVGLLPLGNYGGSTWTHGLVSTSSAIDHAAPATSTSTDQRGFTRYVLPDAGAIEYQQLSSTTEQLVNTTVTGLQLTFAGTVTSGQLVRSSQQAVAMSADGSYVVVWSSQNQDGSGWSTVARRFQSTGTAITGELLVNQTTSGDQKWARVAADRDGNFVVTWTSNSQDGTSTNVYARRYDAQGNALGNEFQISSTSNGRSNSVVAIDHLTGNVIFAFEGNSNDSQSSIFYRRFSANGIALDMTDQFANLVERGNESDAAIAVLSSGQFAIAWTVNQQLYLQRFANSGTRLGSEIGVRVGDVSVSNPTLSSDGLGNFIVIWQEAISGDTSIVGQIYQDDGSVQHNLFTLATVSVTNPSVSMSVDGTFVASWQRDNGAQNADIIAGRFNADGTIIGSPLIVNHITNGDQYLPSVAALDQTQFVVVWSGVGGSDSDGVFSRQFGTATGVNQTPLAVTASQYQIAEGDSLLLDASQSYDSDGSITEYQWDLNGDGMADVTGATPTVSWAQLQSFGIQSSSATPYEISLKVIDNLGWSGLTTTSLTVTDTPPQITVTGTGVITRENDYTINFNATDAGAETLVGWTVQWGDGTTSQLASGSSTATHRYSAVGQHSVTVQLEDLDGVHNAAPHLVTVNAGNAAPNAIDDSFNIVQGGTISGGAITDWFNDAWSFRRTLAVPLTGSSVSLVDHPVLIRLHASASDAINVNYNEFAANGNDLRFVDLAGNQLSYQIESWNTSGYSYLWVKVPLLENAGNHNQFYMYYGNSGAAAGQTPSSVWNSQYVGVYHFDQNTIDSTSNAVNGTGTSVTAATGQIAGAQSFNGTDSKIDLGSTARVDNLFDGGGTVSAWIYLQGWGEGGFGRILDKSDDTSGSNGFAFQVDQVAGSSGQLMFEKGFSNSVGRWRTASGSITLNRWYHITLTYDSASVSNTPSIYIDGELQSLTVSSSPSGTSSSDATSNMTVGNRDDATDRTFNGMIDELRLSKGQRSAAWVMQEFRSEKSAPVTQIEIMARPMSVRLNDTDAENDTLTVSLVSGPSYATTFNLNSTGMFTYQHNGGFSTQDSFVYRVTDSMGASSFATATFNISPVNTPPTIGAISNQTIAEDSTMGPVSFVVGDAEQDVSSLVVTAQSSNQAVVADSDIQFGGSGANRTISLSPKANAFGNTLISISVNDGIQTTIRSFTLAVTAVNDAPSVTPIPDKVILEDQWSGQIAFGVADVDTSIQNLMISATSGNASLIQNSMLVLSGAGSQRFLSFQPVENASGSATITITVSDGNETSSTSFTVTVNAVNDPPVISPINDHVHVGGEAPADITFTVSDVDTTVQPQQLLAYSSAPQLVRSEDLQITGSGNHFTLHWTPQSNVYGATVITLSADDGQSTSSESFLLTIHENSAPTISTVSSIAINEDAVPGPIQISVNDSDSPIGSLVVTVNSSDQSVVRAADVIVSGTGASRQWNWAPVANASGTTTITFTVSDGLATSSQDVTVVVNPVNDPPTLSNITNQEAAQSDASLSIPFSLADIDTNLSQISFQATSSNQVLVANSNLNVIGSGTSRSLVIDWNIAEFGTSTIVLQAEDGQSTVTTSFILTVHQNVPPTITSISSVTVDEDQTSNPIGFTVQDLETQASALTVVATSSNQNLIANQSLLVTGSGANRQVQWSPEVNASGDAVVTLTVTDGIDSNSVSFTVTVNPINDLPVASNDTARVAGFQDNGIAISNLLGNDIDIENDNLTFHLMSQPQHGRLEIIGGVIKYFQSDLGVESDSFSYRVFDGSGFSNIATVELQLEPSSLAGFAVSPDAAFKSPATAEASADHGSASDSSGTSSSTSADGETANSSTSAGTSTATSSDSQAALAMQVSMAMATQHAQHAGHGLQSAGNVNAMMHAGLQASREHDNTSRGLDLGVLRAEQSFERIGTVVHGGIANQPGAVSSESVNGIAAYQTTLSAPVFWDRLDAMRDELQTSLSLNSTLSVGTAASTTAGMTVGYVAWVMRSGLLFSSMMTQLPVWRFMDPLTIIESSDSDQDGDDESINSMVDGEVASDEINDPIDEPHS